MKYLQSVRQSEANVINDDILEAMFKRG